MARIRLYVDHPLGEAQRVPLSRDQAHYLFSVMRLGVGDEILLFNGRDGEWRAGVHDSFKKGGVLECWGQSGPQISPPDVWLLGAAIRKDRMSFMVEKAVELGAARIVPVQTEFTQDARRIKQEKLQAIAVEAAEQCGGTYVPEVAEVVKLRDVLKDWDTNRRFLFCDEELAGPSSALDGVTVRGAPWAILIGPEGGFSEAEREQIKALDCAHAISLGPRILRAETAAVAALTLWQQALGDWG